MFRNRRIFYESLELIHPFIALSDRISLENMNVINWIVFVILVKNAIAFKLFDRNVLSNNVIPSNYKQFAVCEYISDVIRGEKLIFECAENSRDLLNENAETIACHQKYQSDSFVNKSYIEQISLENCQFDQVQNEYFTVFRNLRHLNLSSSSLKSLNQQDFQYADRLKQLIVSHNQLTVLPESVFLHAPKIIVADFEDNRIDTIEPHAFYGGDLSVLDLSRNLLKAITSDWLEDLKELKVLYLSHNKINRIEWNIFKLVQELHWLDLSHNNIGNFDWRTFHSLPVLKVLNLVDTGLTEIPPQMFVGTKELRKLYLSQNQIHTIDLNTISLYSPLNHLSEIYLDGNALEQLEPLANDTLPSLAIMGIADNPLNCTLARKFKESTERRAILLFPDILNEGVKNYRGVVCSQ